jgi:solute carrier family 25 carnitine/acylcarnitine transporter 20/29
MSADFWAGYISGAAGILIGNPLDLIKVRLQARTPTASLTPSNYPAQFATAGSLVRGATAPILGYGALNALLFMTYNRTTVLLDNSPPSAASLCTIWLAGAVGGLATWVVSTPIELIKCRAQFSSTSTSLAIAREILRTEGLRGLYFGGVVTVLRDSIGYGFYFGSYELGTRLMTRGNDTNDGHAKIEAGSISTETAKVLLCGGIAGIATWASIFPLDVIKTRVQTQRLPNQSPGNGETSPLLGPTRPSPSTTVSDESLGGRRIGAMEMARKTYTEEGIAVFFRGLTVCSVRAFVVNAVQWAVYEWIMKELQPGNKA